VEMAGGFFSFLFPTLLGLMGDPLQEEALKWSYQVTGL
jgi:hypothetical protein